jgi:hypothetical protein
VPQTSPLPARPFVLDVSRLPDRAPVFPAVGEDVSHLFKVSEPPVGADVSELFRTSEGRVIDLSRFPDKGPTVDPWDAIPAAKPKTVDPWDAIPAADDRSLLGRVADTVVPAALRIGGAIAGGAAGAVGGPAGIVAGGAGGSALRRDGR